ncbi:MAG: S-adenosylmethionine:tRNA ribosyltransferase-isomerase, partial [Planctomycetes bacterium]|nr:S-adenosylmethionine:tRNA ribosyltransferase-isomerase [Planctomycetota bacterium]
MQTSDFDYHLPETSIAQEAIEPRDAAKMLHFNISTHKHSHHQVSELTDFIDAKDLIVFNTTKVF